MSEHLETSKRHQSHRAPGEIKDSVRHAVIFYAVGLALAGILTAFAFSIALGQDLWRPSVIVWLAVLAIAQVVVHLIFFLHLSTGPEDGDNLMVVVFGLLIVILFGVGSLWIMMNLNSNMDMPGMNMPGQNTPGMDAGMDMGP